VDQQQERETDQDLDLSQKLPGQPAVARHCKPQALAKNEQALDGRDGHEPVVQA
jgi:hypothetical protein